MVNTEQAKLFGPKKVNYNILNIVVNTEQRNCIINKFNHYNILNIVVNTELLKLQC